MTIIVYLYTCITFYDNYSLVIYIIAEHIELSMYSH